MGLIGCMEKKENILAFRRWALDNGFNNDSEALRYVISYAIKNLEVLRAVHDTNRR